MDITFITNGLQGFIDSHSLYFTKYSVSILDGTNQVNIVFEEKIPLGIMLFKNDLKKVFENFRKSGLISDVNFLIKFGQHKPQMVITFKVC